MLSKALRSFSSAPHVKFPAGTVAGQYKIAVNTNAERDIIRFDNQKLNWTLKEFDVSFHQQA